MKISIVLALCFPLFLCGCASAKKPPYPVATSESKKQLYQDLKSKKLQGSTIDYIRSTYGEPEVITDYGRKILFIYRRPAYYDSAYLWFDDGKHLTSWSH